MVDDMQEKQHMRIEILMGHKRKEKIEEGREGGNLKL